MGFTEAVRTVLKEKYATFSGRASRSEYWWYSLFYILACIVITAVLIGIAAASGNGQGPVVAISIIGGLLILATIVPALAVLIRRFHDRNISGWWYLALAVLSLVPYVGLLTGIATLVICVLPGTVGPNKFGPDPLRPEARAEVFA